MDNPDPASDGPPEPRGLVALVALALVVGVAAGAIGAAFRASLDWADRMRNALIAAERTAAPTDAGAGFALVVGLCAAAALIAAWLVKRFSRYASGSGIPHVEVVLSGLLPPAPLILGPVKFVGGVLAIGAGLALGREGPSVQLGATIAIFVGRLFRLPWED